MSLRHATQRPAALHCASLTSGTDKASVEFSSRVARRTVTTDRTNIYIQI